MRQEGSRAKRGGVSFAFTATLPKDNRSVMTFRSGQTYSSRSICSLVLGSDRRKSEVAGFLSRKSLRGIHSLRLYPVDFPLLRHWSFWVIRWKRDADAKMASLGCIVGCRCPAWTLFAFDGSLNGEISIANHSVWCVRGGSGLETFIESMEAFS